METIGRIERAMTIIKQLETLKFSEKEIIGLSKSEKHFIAENDYNVVLKQNDDVLYMFIAKNELGEKQLYAITKKQSIYPNAHDICQSAYNYECWLLFDAKKEEFSKFYYERRFRTIPNIILIFA